MNSSFKIIVGFAAAIIVAAVFYFESQGQENPESEEKIYAPVIKILGKPVDTAYLLADYKDQGAEYLCEPAASHNCNRYCLVTKKSGTVNTRIAGTYYITYYAEDSLGNPLSTQTRTVSVVENEAGFLNGAYQVSFSQTITPAGAKSVTTTSGTYTALVTPGSHNAHFNLYSLNIGPEALAQDIYLIGDSLEINRFTTDYVSILGGGKIDRAGGSFTIESTVYPFSPKVTYKCRNVFTKQLVLGKQLVFTSNSSKER